MLGEAVGGEGLDGEEVGVAHHYPHMAARIDGDSFEGLCYGFGYDVCALRRGVEAEAEQQGGDILGFYALVYMFIGYLNGFFKSIFYPEDIKLPMILIAASELAYCFICFVFLFMLRGKFNLGYYFIHIFLPEIAYTILVTLIVYKLILYVNEWLDRVEKRHA